MAFTATQHVQTLLGSVRTESLPVLQPAEQRQQPRVVSQQGVPLLFAGHGAFRPGHVARRTPTTSAAAWLGPSALLAAALIARVAQTDSESSGVLLQINSSTVNRALQYTPTQYARLPRRAKRSYEERLLASKDLDAVYELTNPNLAQGLRCRDNSGDINMVLEQSQMVVEGDTGRARHRDIGYMQSGVRRPERSP